jgi:hypothetical protein
MAKTVFDVLKEKIVAHKTAIADSLISGASKDFAEYRELCGLIRGLEIAQREVQDLAQNFLDDDDE